MKQKTKGIVIRRKVIRRTISTVSCEERGEYLAGKIPSEEVKITNGAEVFTQKKERFLALFDNYGIDKGDYFNLSWALACRWEDSMQLVPEKKDGAPEKWNPVLAFFLWWDVEMYLRKSKAGSVIGACTHLSKQLCWKDKGFTVAALNNAYTKKALESVLVKVAKRHLNERRVKWEDLDKYVTQFLKGFGGRQALLSHMDAIGYGRNL